MTPTKRRLEGQFKRRREERFWFSPSQRSHYDFDVADPNIRRAILKVSHAVVSVVSFAGEDIFLVASGTIIKCEDVNGTYSSSILNCASLLRSSTDSNTMGDNIKVCLVDGKSFNGCISAHDHHYNIAIMKITSDVALPSVSLATLDDSISTDLSESPSLRCPSSSVKLCPGDGVVALGRLGSDTTELMAALGKFSDWFGPYELLNFSLLGPYSFVTGLALMSFSTSVFLDPTHLAQDVRAMTCSDYQCINVLQAQDVRAMTG